MELEKGYKQTEIGIFPEDWKILTIRDIASVISGGTPSTSNEGFWDGEILWCTPTDITSNNKKYISETKRKITDLGVLSSSASILPIGAILFCSRATIGAMSIAKNEITTNQGFKSLVVKANCYNEFLYYRLHLDLNKFIEKSIGSTFLEISKKDTLEILIPIPSTLTEQKAIAQVLTDIDQLIQNLKTLIAKKKAIIQGAMQELLTGKKRLKGFKSNWKNKKLGEVASIQRGASPRPIKDAIWFDEKSNVGWVRILDVTKSKKYLKKTVQKLSESGINNSRYVASDNLIMSICATIGRPIITQINVCVHDGFVVFNDLKVYKNYLYYYLTFIEEEWSKNGQTGSQMNLNTGLINETRLNFPENKTEQKAIAQILSDMDLEIEALETQLQKTQNLKQGMMQELLTGKIRLVNSTIKSNKQENQNISIAAESETVFIRKLKSH